MGENDTSKRRRTVGLALISLVTNIAHKQRNAFLPIHLNIHGITVVAEETCECRIYRGEGYQWPPSTLSFKHTYQGVSSPSDVLLLWALFHGPSLCAAVVVVGVDVEDTRDSCIAGWRACDSCLHVDSSFLKKYTQDFLLTFGPGITGTIHNRCFGKPC